jgi:hypothetical protein
VKGRWFESSRDHQIFEPTQHKISLRHTFRNLFGL